MNYWLDNCENHSGLSRTRTGDASFWSCSHGRGQLHARTTSRTRPARSPDGRSPSRFRCTRSATTRSEFMYLPRRPRRRARRRSWARSGNFERRGHHRHHGPAAARPSRFIARHLYNFFVADEPQVPAWNIEPPNDPEAIDALVQAYFDNDGDIRPVLRTLFNSDFFKAAQFRQGEEPGGAGGRHHQAGGHLRRDPGSGLSLSAR